MNAATLPTDSFAFTTRTRGFTPITLIGLKSLTGSQPVLVIAGDIITGPAQNSV